MSKDKHATALEATETRNGSWDWHTWKCICGFRISSSDKRSVVKVRDGHLENAWRLYV